MYHVWDKEQKKYLRLAQNSYVKLGSVYTTYSGVLHAVKGFANYPQELGNNKRPNYPERLNGALPSQEEYTKYWNAIRAFYAARAVWWKANKDRPWEELINPRYELHEM